MFAKHGFQDLAEKAKLGRYFVGKVTSSELEGYSAPERMRMAFESLGPTFVKLGQLLATRPDLVPEEFRDEFKKLHDHVPALSFSEIRQVLDDQFGKNFEDIFQSFDETPLAAASIAQVHQAVLRNGDRVVVKIQRPGIDKIINEDLNVLYTLAVLVQRYVPEAKVVNPVSIVDEFFKSLQLETNFVVEANNLRRFQENFHMDHDVVIPSVYSDLTGQRVLVMERLEGIPLSHQSSLSQEGIDPEIILKKGLRTYLRMVFIHGLFHGDLHSGNIFVLPYNRIGLIDFGVVGRLNNKTQSAIANMLLALANEDYDRLAYLYVDMAPYAGSVDIDRFARELRDLIAPYHGLTSKHVNIGKLLMDSTSVAFSQGLILPSELIMFFKSMVTIEGMGHLISEDFDFLSSALEFADELVMERYQPQRVLKEVGYATSDLMALVRFLPRQIRQLARKWNSPDYSVKISIQEIDQYRRSMEKASDLIFLGLIIAALLLSSSVVLLAQVPMATLFGLPFLSSAGYSLAALLGAITFLNYLRR